ncbi:MAG: peptidoglycan-binding protein [Plectolyngbya sp. WJT66-NPBG17]|jgi:murein L,D-transpeptidase YcbB/YkuD|nr:peptidoglycan-binding protein [Plectolyngbya sp. WJT66-NPBG17]
MEANQVTLQASAIDLKAVCRYFEPFKYKHQSAAVNWLETQLSYPTFRAFTQRWENQAVSPDPVLQLNNTGAAVYELQQLLNKTGAKLLVDGSFGAKTQAAVIQFQRNNALTADGIVGNLTWATLRKLVDQRYLWKMFDAYNPTEKPHQTRALDWLQTQISTATLTEFARRWRTA